MKFADDCLTEPDNSTYSLARVILASSVAVYLSLSILDVIRTKDFEYEHFGIGISAIIAAGNSEFLFGLKQKKTEDK